MEEEGKREAEDERPPICPACGVTMGIIVDEAGTTHYVCLECGFSDETPGNQQTEARGAAREIALGYASAGGPARRGDPR